MPLTATITAIEGDTVTCTLEDGQVITLSASALARDVLNTLLGHPHENHEPLHP
jgi:hypothetical protein